MTSKATDSADLPVDLNLLSFLGHEHTNFLVSFNALRQEFALFAHLDLLYQAGIRGDPVPPSNWVQMQLLLFCHYHLYYATSTLLRCHLSDAFASLRTAIDASLHAYRIIEGHGTPEQYINRDKTFIHSANYVRRKREKDASVMPLAEHLLKIHEACSRFASHADFDAFGHRLELVRKGTPMLKVHYFQHPKDVPEFQFYAVTMLHTFVVILNVFEKVLVDLKRVDQSWSKKLRAIGTRLEEWRKQLREPSIPTRDTSDNDEAPPGSEGDPQPRS